MTSDIIGKPKAYSYLRFSRPEQGMGDSLRRQLEEARKYADQHDLELDDSLRDEGISAFRSKNRDDKSALGSFLKMVSNGTVQPGSYLLVENLDRLSRDQVPTALSLFLNILQQGIIIVSLNDRRSYSWDSVSNSESELLISISAMTRAHGESATKSIRVAEAWEKKRAEAERSGKAMTKICPGWIMKRRDRYVLIEDRAAIIRRIFRMCIEGMGTRTIAKTLNQESVERWGKGKKKGVLWYDSYIKKILDNPATYGEFTPRGKLAGGSDATASPPLRNYFPAAIDFKTFMQARAMREARASSSARSTPGKHRNILSGLLKCASCGGGMHYIDKGKRGGRPYLQCGNSLLKGGCDHKSKHVYETLETDIIRQCASTVGEAENAKAVDERACALAYTDVAARLEHLVDAIELHGMSDTLKRRLISLEKEKVEAEKELVTARNAASRRNVALGFGVDMKEAATLAMRLREEPENSQLRAYAANMVLSTIEKISIGPDRRYETWTLGYNALQKIPDEKEVMEWARRWLFGPKPIDPNRKYTMATLPPLYTKEEIENS